MAFRAFVAVPIPRSAPIERLLDGLAGTRGDLKVVDADHLHMTLSFLGNVPDDAAPPIGAALDEALRGVKRFAARLRGVGAFPAASRPRVVWVGVEEPAPLAAMATRVRARLATIGRPDDGKDFRAHVTLARARSERGAADVVRFLREHGTDALPEVPIEEVRLFRSTLAPGGPSYDALHATRLEA